MHVCGRLLCAGRPGSLRLLSGRVLQQESQRIGRPLGVVCAVGSGTYAAVKVYEASPTSPFGPLTAIGAAVVLACAAASALTAAVESRAARAHTTAALRRLGAPASVLYRAAALRTSALVIVLGPLTWARRRNRHASAGALSRGPAEAEDGTAAARRTDVGPGVVGAASVTRATTPDAITARLR